MVETAAVENPEINALFEDLRKFRLIKKEEDIIKDAVSEMVIKHGRFPKEIARGILNSKISGKLSDTVAELRGE
jgi:hypothetical protein